MNMKDDVRNIIIAGSWNIPLISPKWLNDNIFEGKLPEKIRLSLNLEDIILKNKIMELPKFKLEVSTGRICFMPNKQDTEHYDIITDKALSILSRLPHTPVHTLGINFIFSSEEYTWFNKIINAKFIDDFEEYTNAKTTTLKFQLGSDDEEDNTLILKIDLDNKKERIFVNFNYSYKVKDISEVKEILRIGLLDEMKEKCEKIIDSIIKESNE